MPARRRTAPRKIRLGSIYLTERAHAALIRLIDRYGHGPSGTIETLIIETDARIQRDVGDV